MKVVFIYESLHPPFDEGVKKFAKNLYDVMLRTHSVTLIRDITRLPSVINKLFLLPRVMLTCLLSHPDRIVYIPQGALTFLGIIKVWLLRIFLNRRLSVVGVQRRILRNWQQWITCRLTLCTIHVMSAAMARELRQLGINAEPLNAGIDRNRYAPAANIFELRKKYGLHEDQPVLLHVGHIKESRNIRWLLDIRRALPEIQVVVVGSTSTEQDASLREALVCAGIVVTREYVPNIQELYQLATWYLFPVMKEDGAMEIPLSVLESMAVNLPVITTRFGRLPELFREDTGYRYVSTSDDVTRLLREGFGHECQNRNKTEPFSWEESVASLLGTAKP